MCIRDRDYTMELIYQTLYQLRVRHHFNGYIHVKAIPGADPVLIEKAGFLADRMSVNLELPTADGLKALAPNKSRKTILKPMRLIQNGITENQNELMVYRKTPKFVPAGQSTQMIIGATPENDYQIMKVADVYKRQALPMGAVCTFAISPTERVRETFSYFSLIPFGYANFAPLITAILTVVVLLLSLISLKKDSVFNALFVLSIIKMCIRDSSNMEEYSFQILCI